MHAITVNEMRRHEFEGELGGAMGRFEGRSVYNYNKSSKIK